MLVFSLLKTKGEKKRELREREKKKIKEKKGVDGFITGYRGGLEQRLHPHASEFNESVSCSRDLGVRSSAVSTYQLTATASLRNRRAL